MAEKRRAKRYPRRLKVRFGEANKPGFPHSGLTNDVSSSGLFVVSGQNTKPGTRLHLEVLLPGDAPLYLEGIVMRQVLVPTELRQVVKSGFGVRYLSGAELMAELVPALSTTRKEDPFYLPFLDEGSWRSMVDKELRRGGVFIWSNKPLSPSSTLTVTFDLRFMEQILAFESKVVHCMPGPDGRMGIALLFTDAPSVALAIAKTLGDAPNASSS